MAAAALVLALGGAGADPALAQNLLPNAHFHTDNLDWTLETGADLLWSNLSDAGGCTNSGIALVVSEDTGAEHVAEISYCLAVTPGTIVSTLMSHRGYGVFHLGIRQFGTVDCSGPASQNSWTTVNQLVEPWQYANFGAEMFPGMDSMELYARAIDSKPHGLQLDDASASLIQPLFEDGFDGNDSGTTDPCRWSATFP